MMYQVQYTLATTLCKLDTYWYQVATTMVLATVLVLADKLVILVVWLGIF